MPIKFTRRTRIIFFTTVIAAAAIFALAQLPWPTLLGDAITYINGQQRIFHDQMALHMRAIKETHSLLATLALVAAGFTYGVFHALGPCHDKMVITGYMLANKRSIRRGMIVNALASLLQAVTAMVLVLGLFYLLGFARAAAEHIASLMEMGSFVFVVCLGIRQILQSVRDIIGANHVHDEHCGHAHMADAAQVEKAKGFRDLAVMTLSLGIRPCSGAVLLLVFACILGTIGAGIAATFAMAIGSAVMTAVLALMAVQSKNWALKFFKFSERDLTLTHAVLGIAGGAIIAIMGAFFAYAAIRAEMPVATETQPITAYHHPLMGGAP